jgi:hypothetical protein
MSSVRDQLARLIMEGWPSWYWGMQYLYGMLVRGDRETAVCLGAQQYMVFELCFGGSEVSSDQSATSEVVRA